MLIEDDLILTENAMKKSEEKIGYLVRGATGKRYISSTSIYNAIEKSKNEQIIKYIVIYCKNGEKVLNTINLEKLKQIKNKDFRIYIVDEKNIKEYKI